MSSYLKLLAGAAAVISVAAAASPASAANANKKYCLNPSSGGSSCGFVSLEQCQETQRGRNGWCSEQVDFGAWAAEHQQPWMRQQPESSFAYYGGPASRRRMSRDEPDMEKLHKDDMPSKGVGAE